MDFDLLFSFLTQDKNWVKKVSIAAILILSQIGVIAVLGWAAEISKRVADGQTESLPEWDEIGRFFLNGLKLIGVTLVWFLPPALLVVCQSTVMIASMQGGDPSTLAAVLTASSVVVYLLVFIYIIAGGLIFSPLYVLVTEEQDFKQLLKPGPAWHLFRGNLGGFILTILIGSLFSLVLVLSGFLVCFVGSFFGAALGFTFLGILIGLATGQARKNISQNTTNSPIQE